MNVETNSPTTVVNKIFYTGYTLSTLGLGDMEPEGNFWDILTAILSFTGLILISIANLFNSSSFSRDSKEKNTNTIGGSVEEMLLNYWDGKDFKVRTTFFPLIDSIISHAQNHKAYSVLHFFRPTDEKHLYLISQTSTNYLPYCFLIYQRNKTSSQYTYQAQEGYIELPHNTTSNLYNSRKKNAPYPSSYHT
jgi:hypothetical protein